MLAGLVPGSRPLVVSRRVAFPVRARWKYRRAARYSAVSEFVKAVLIEGGVSPERIDVVYDGVPLLSPARGQEVLSLSVKGTALTQQAAQLAGVTLTLSSNLEDDLPRGALFLYATESEGLGSGVLMAMSAGVPVIASRIGGLQEVICDGENGILVRNDVHEFADAIRRLTGDPAAASRMGDAARRTVMEKFTVERMVRRTMEVYSQVLS
jgi:hypothetical protein